MYDDEQFVAEALLNNAKGYILKQAMDDELFSALEAVLRGGQYVSSAIDMGRVQEHLIESPDLTAREREVLQLIADGHTTQELAEILSISPHTATRHRANLMHKLNAHNQVELVRAAAQKGIIILK
jgi:DNA-binding NarL/FixJ family response regulator